MHVFEESVAMVDRLSDLLRAQDHCKTDGKEDKGAGTNYSDTAKTPIPIKSDHYQSYSQTFSETTYVASSADSEDESDLESGFGDLSSSSEEDDREREDMVEKAGSDAFGAAVPQQTPYGRRRHSCPEATGAQKGSRPSIPMLPIAHIRALTALTHGHEAEEGKQAVLSPERRLRTPMSRLTSATSLTSPAPSFFSKATSLPVKLPLAPQGSMRTPMQYAYPAHQVTTVLV
jgi:hypothetical protein